MLIAPPPQPTLPLCHPPHGHQGRLPLRTRLHLGLWASSRRCHRDPQPVPQPRRQHRCQARDPSLKPAASSSVKLVYRQKLAQAPLHLLRATKEGGAMLLLSPCQVGESDRARGAEEHPLARQELYTHSRFRAVALGVQSMPRQEEIDATTRFDDGSLVLPRPCGHELSRQSPSCPSPGIEAVDTAVCLSAPAHCAACSILDAPSARCAPSGAICRRHRHTARCAWGRQTAIQGSQLTRRRKHNNSGEALARRSTADGVDAAAIARRATGVVSTPRAEGARKNGAKLVS
eukprot:scaffold105433_cov31-Tisochrysis_lutea.AAC.8